MKENEGKWRKMKENERKWKKMKENERKWKIEKNEKMKFFFLKKKKNKKWRKMMENERKWKKMKENERKWMKKKENERKWKKMKENEWKRKKMSENERKWKKMKENERKMKENDRKWKKMIEKWKIEKKEKFLKRNQMKKMKKWKKMEKWKKKKTKKFRKMMKKERKMKKLDSHAKSSTISRVYRCCCNFFRQNPRRFPWFCFGMCLFPEENQQPVLRSHGFSEEKWQFSLDVKQKHTFYQRKSTKKSIRSAHLTIIILLKEPFNNNNIRGWRNWIREDPLVHPYRWLRPDLVPPAPFLQCELRFTPNGSGVLSDPNQIDEEFRKAWLKRRPAFAASSWGSSSSVDWSDACWRCSP